MDLEAPPQVEEEAVWRFTIPSSDPLGRPIIAINDATFDYNSDIVQDDGTKKPVSEYLLQKINFGVDNASKIGKKPLYFVVVVVVLHENQIKSNHGFPISRIAYNRHRLFKLFCPYLSILYYFPSSDITHQSYSWCQRTGKLLRFISYHPTMFAYMPIQFKTRNMFSLSTALNLRPTHILLFLITAGENNIAQFNNGDNPSFIGKRCGEKRIKDRTLYTTSLGTVWFEIIRHREYVEYLFDGHHDRRRSSCP